MTQLNDDQLLQILKTPTQPKNNQTPSDEQLLEILKTNKPIKDLGGLPTIKVTGDPKSNLKGSRLEGGIIGAVNDIGGGINQIDQSIRDKLSGLSNLIFGTNLDTGRYERVTKGTQKINDEYEAQRIASGRTGFDGARLLGNIAGTATSPMSVGKTLLGTAAKAAATGAGIGAVSFAKDSNERVKNITGGAVGGAAGGVVGHKVGQKVSNLITRVTPSNASVQNIDKVINSALKNSSDDAVRGLTVTDLSSTARESLRNEIKSVLKKGKSADSQTVERMAIFNDLKASGVNLKPTGKQATGNPKLWTKETELSKLDGGDALNNRYISQNKELIDALEQASVATKGTSINRLQTGESVINALSTKDTARNQLIKDMYQVAKNHSGNDLVINPHAVVQNSKQAMVDNFINPDKAQSALLAKLKPFMDADNPKPFTLKDKELFVKQLNTAIGGTTDGETRKALSLVRNALEEEVDNSLNQFGNALSGEAKNAWIAARSAASQRFKDIERNPALKAAIDDIAPDHFFEKFVLSKSSTVRDVKALTDELKDQPEAMNNLRLEVMRFVADNAVTKQGDGISPVGINRALQTIGDDKLKLFFNVAELKHLKNLNAASKYLFSQPMGSNVNHSNSTSAFINLIGYMNLLKKVPVIGPKLDAVSKNAVDSVNAQMKINQGANAISKTAKTNPQAQNQSLIDRLVKAGILSGANLPQQ